MNKTVEYNTMNKIRKVSREQLLEKIKSAQKEICMIGTIAFDLPWNEMADELCEKFTDGEFVIRILRESETIIAQYSLLMLSQDNDGEFGTLSRGNLVGIKDKTIRELKTALSNVNGGKNIEPPENVYAKELGMLFYSEKRRYILKSYALNGSMDDFCDYMEGRVRDVLEDKKSAFLGNPDFIRKVATEIASDPGLVSRYAELVDAVISGAHQKISKLIREKDFLPEMVLPESFSNAAIKVNKKGQSSLEYKLMLDAEGLSVCEPALFDFEKWIDEFTLPADKEEKNYRIAADKVQAVKRATDLRRIRLEEYESNLETRQRLFIKNCYMPIPVPMIKVDDELFITMALTKFDSVNKYQYVGMVAYNEEKGRYVAATREDGYRSLWLDEFADYYQEYFGNKNGAQKYSTEETAKGDRKEVIDIFDENRIRIGVGPRDAFLSNLAIVKSVVWALIFDRKGRILIHQRAQNAKDNQGLWDKSVGGHVSTEDLDTIEAIKREIAEELFTIEHEGQSGHDMVEWMITNKNKIIYLGDWKTNRFPDLSALNLSPDEYYNFSLNYPDINKRDFRREIVITERLLPNGETVKAKCFVDPYLCVVSEDFDISSLKNSRYALLTPNELKRCVIKKKIKLNQYREYDAINGAEEDFKPTSDLAYLVESGIWDDIVTEFAKRVKETFA